MNITKNTSAKGFRVAHNKRAWVCRFKGFIFLSSSYSARLLLRMTTDIFRHSERSKEAVSTVSGSIQKNKAVFSNRLTLLSFKQSPIIY
ncbi:MAG: hypothetical protein ACI4B8_03435 [Candidatus Gastranaerophilaceae bacterium]